MSAVKPLASLSSGLLARKGAAKPAMRPQLLVGSGEAIPALTREEADLNDLGWNDLGEADAAQTEKPVVVQQQEALAQAVAPYESEPVPRRRMKAGKEVRSALHEGRKAAFTLRLDHYRHLRLRLASTLEDRSAQAVVTEALDRYLAELPEVEALARRAVGQN
ncbi:MAG: hypothetical protein B7Y31_05245 [Novosphingobium sp. 16-62-11]|uniref:hypothetical protein n=1 Tax=Novosphingobium sp. 17-62-19 TaxID=1970406 RepID=UPI000BD02026|nr:hypothetical protein [Novosphingobium sp. 17-62-19]OYX92073.1 MAG: hypothetical protein B7Y74_13010 [Novosphingobium sp. 35-62-5]OYZ42326.1 MAG: hypothetical protein B7Y31_05245 [Novosphingobium sp. 16-62-11]OZA57836.1 MAG: hypothetical protein B7X78_09220 [Sphingomonadales bacterium 39-62-4]HQS96574.1 hypothetical protein [Novosphingobium sp.]OZA17591.1 MAG: hypothetical protein B7X90_14465 [Novosphingobium sp. 17-62-19]